MFEFDNDLLRIWGEEGKKKIIVAECFKRSNGYCEYFEDVETAISVAKQEWKELSKFDKKEFAKSGSYFRVGTACLYFDEEAEEWCVSADREDILWTFENVLLEEDIEYAKEWYKEVVEGKEIELEGWVVSADSACDNDLEKQKELLRKIKREIECINRQQKADPKEN